MWQGEYTCSRARFACFKTTPEGYRAMFINLRNYITSGADTISKMINRWAPTSDNNPTATYIKNVEAWTGINRDTKIDPNDAASLKKIVAAISHQENGVAAVASDVDAGFELAKSRFGEYVKAGAGLLGIVAIGAILYFIFKPHDNE